MSSPVLNEINDAISDGTLDDVFYGITYIVPGDVDPVTGDEQPPQEYTCQGMREEYSKEMISGGVVEKNDQKILILQDSLDVTPSTDDEITVNGDTYTVIDFEQDPAGALWEVQARA